MPHELEKPKSKLTSILSGVAGQYFVAAELSRHGYVATVTLRNTRGIDILAANANNSRSVGIQVKTNQGRAKEWMLNSKAELMHGKNLFYVFVNLNGISGMPEYHVVESDIIADYVKQNHTNWLAGTKRDGSPRKDTSMRIFRDDECIYRDAWNRLGLDGDSPCV